MVAKPDDTNEQVPPKERARQRKRDRKRETRMVVDNAGVRRIVSAVKRKKTRS
ncbi:MAG: hypothetical protein ABR498_01475 [Candidatus Dormibacteria bacterium]